MKNEKVQAIYDNTRSETGDSEFAYRAALYAARKELGGVEVDADQVCFKSRAPTRKFTFSDGSKATIQYGGVLLYHF